MKTRPEGKERKLPAPWLLSLESEFIKEVNQ